MFSKYAKAFVALGGGALEVLNRTVVDLALNADTWLTTTLTVVIAGLTAVGVAVKENGKKAV